MIATCKRCCGDSFEHYHIMNWRLSRNDARSNRTDANCLFVCLFFWTCLSIACACSSHREGIKLMSIMYGSCVYHFGLSLSIYLLSPGAVNVSQVERLVCNQWQYIIMHIGFVLGDSVEASEQTGIVY